MSEEIKLVMLGHAGIGKTTYMASLYGAMQQSVAGFRLKSPKDTDHTRLLALSKNIQVGNYPSGTDQRSEYSFTLLYKGKDLFEFKWADYRGKAIVETTDSSQAQHLQNDLKDADGLLMFCDSCALAQGNIRVSQLGRMISLVHLAVQDRENPLALAVILTKSDLISSFNLFMLTHFNGLIGAVNASDRVSGMMIPTACGTKPSNIHIPFLFALSTMVFMKAMVLQHYIEQYEQLKETYDHNSRGVIGFFDRIISAFTEESTYAELAEKLKQQLSEWQGEFEHAVESVNSLAGTLQKFPVFEENKSLSDYLEQLNQVHNGVTHQDRWPSSKDSVWAL